MKRNISLSAILLAAASALSLTSCGTLYTTSDIGGSGYYDLGIYNDYYPTPPGSPWISPVYWGSQLYPAHPAPPAIAPSRPGAPTFYPGANRPSGNSRPTQAATPATQPDAIQVPSGPINVSGGQPGIVTPPAGSGLRPTAPGRH